jgi:DNA polymerase/3'-5' exonuclease PolX
MDYAIALTQAQDIVKQLAPYCERCEIAGSIRRRKAFPKDIEVVAIPKMVTSGLFDDETCVHPGFCAVVDQWARVKGYPTGRYTQRLLPTGMKLDLFMADDDSFGNILLIRTGDADFSRWMMGSLLPTRGYRAHDGYLWKDDQRLSTPEETDVFDLAGLPYRDPWDRTGAEMA